MKTAFSLSHFVCESLVLSLSVSCTKTKLLSYSPPLFFSLLSQSEETQLHFERNSASRRYSAVRDKRQIGLLRISAKKHTAGEKTTTGTASLGQAHFLLCPSISPRGVNPGV
ncbi:unnamed protein product [Sphagnum tenellum]